jgi:predicted permease
MAPRDPAGLADAHESVAWRVVVRRLRRSLPAAHAASTLGDLAEDYAARRARVGSLRADVWLLREARSLDAGYRRAMSTPRGRAMLVDDSRQAWRRLVRHPAAAGLCAALLAVGVGLSTAMFSVVDSLLLRRAPFADPDRLVEMGLWNPEPDVMDAWRASGLFDAVEAVRPVTIRALDDVTGAWQAALVTPGLFEMLGGPQPRGRGFTADDARPGLDDVVVLSEVIWRSTFAADPDLLGRRIRVDDRPAVVVGLVPASFRFPTPTTVVWRPFDPRLDTSSAPTRIVARLRTGVAFSDAERRTAVIARSLAELPASYGGSPPFVAVGRPDQLDSFTTPALWSLLAGAGLVFVALCANVTSLLLANLSARRRDVVLCGALGASRARLLRQAAVEHALIAIAGAAAGVGIAWLLLGVIPDLFVDRTLNPIDVDPRALAAAVALGMASVLMAGLVPAWLGTRGEIASTARATAQAGGETRSSRLATRGLLVGEIALACALLVGAALLIRSFVNLVRADRGIRLDGVTQVAVSDVDEAFMTREANALGTAAIRTAVAAWPEVEAIALSRELPPVGDSGGVFLGPVRPAVPRPSPTATAADIEAWVKRVRSDSIQTDIYRVDASFFDVYGIRLLRGRAHQPSDTPLDAVVGERLASLLWPGADPIGRGFSIGRRTGYRVIGVAREIQLPTLDAELDRPEVYVPLGDDSRTLRLSLRCRASCPDAATMQSRLRAVHPALRPNLITAAEHTYLAQLRLPRALADIAGLFAVVAVITAAGGLFSVLTFAVRRRQREFGIRTALGASPRDLRRLVVGDGLRLACGGTIAGATGGWMAARALAAFQYGVSVADPTVWGFVVVTIAAVALLASWAPSRQAMRCDPVKLLRED